MKSFRLRAAAFAVVGVAALAAIAATVASAGGSGASATSIRFQLSFFPNAQHVGFLVAANRGLYKKAGLDVKVIPGGPTVNPTLALAQGNVDISQVDFPEFLQAVAKGAPMTFIGLTYHQDPLTYVALKSTPLSKPSDLKGKTFGVQQAGPLDAEVQALLAKAGLSTKDIDPVSIGFSIDDLLSKKCDVFPSRIFFHPAQFADAGIKYPTGLNVLDPNKYGVGVASQGLAVNNKFLAAHRDGVVAFLRASLQGWKATVANPRASVADVGKFLPKGANNPKDNYIDVLNTLKIVTHSPNGKPWTKLLAVDMTYLTKSQNILLQYKVTKKKIDLSKTVDTKLMAEAAAG
jgi:NitT/TauT family transport system substrate-binding protein